MNLLSQRLMWLRVMVIDVLEANRQRQSEGRGGVLVLALLVLL